MLTRAEKQAILDKTTVFESHYAEYDEWNQAYYSPVGVIILERGYKILRPCGITKSKHSEASVGLSLAYEVASWFGFDSPLYFYPELVKQGPFIFDRVNWSAD
jgi:hypothetical protein